jgi:hypothetical protein
VNRDAADYGLFHVLGTENLYLKIANFINCTNKRGSSAPMIDVDAVAIGTGSYAPRIFMTEIYYIQCIPDYFLEGGIASDAYLRVFSVYYYGCTFGYLTDNGVSRAPPLLSTKTTYNLNNQSTPEIKGHLIIRQSSYTYEQESVT